jgi:hypothetical protein
VQKIATVWLVSRQSGLFDPSSDLPHALAAVRRPGIEQKWNDISVRPYAKR